MRQRTRSVALLLVILCATASHAWGPHSEITRAACATLPPSDGLEDRLQGAEALAEYCWMADYREHAFAHYFADDYLLFPSFPKHVDHLPPAVLATYAPYFRRALQALRTETPTNAARWVGSLLHFQQDSGAPPHAAEIRGELHTKLENWLDARAIRLTDYQPQLLGDDDESAVIGLQRRMMGLIAYSKERAARARPFCEANDRAAAEPIILESALESARVTADLVHTLLVVARRATRPTPGATFVVRISAPALSAMPKSPARLVLLGTDYATVADLVKNDDSGYLGECALRELPPGTYRPCVYRVGARVHALPTVRVRGGQTQRWNVELEPGLITGNLVRDAERKVRYATPEQLEHWHRIGAGENAAWRTAAIAVEAGATYRIGALFKKDVVKTLRAAVRVRARWDHFVTESALRSDELTGADDKVEAALVAPARALNLRLLFTTDQPIDEALVHAWVVKESPAPREFHLRYLRHDGALEAEFKREHVNDNAGAPTGAPTGARLTSVTHRGASKLTIVTELTMRDEVKSSLVAVESATARSQARAEVSDGRIVIRRADGSEQSFPTDPSDKSASRLIVTSAPDWTDTLLLCERFDPDVRRGVQRFAALWFHPTEPAQLLTFSAERMNGATIEKDGIRLALDKLILTIRGGSRYLAWATAEGRMVKLTPLSRSGTLNQGASLYLEGFERVARDLE